jgi:hypothetical protein
MSDPNSEVRLRLHAIYQAFPSEDLRELLEEIT